MGLLWYSVSRNNALLSSANTLILAGDIVGLNVPEGATLGAIIQKAENTPEYLEKIKGGYPGFGPGDQIENLINWLTRFEEDLTYKPQL